jgi:hypothetical protein
MRDFQYRPGDAGQVFRRSQKGVRRADLERAARDYPDLRRFTVENVWHVRSDAEAWAVLSGH